MGSLLALSPVRYALVGAANTGFGYSLIFLAMLGGVGHAWANAIGYAAGVVLSFVLNRAWTFKSNGAIAGSLGRFLLVTLVAYMGNLLAVVVAVDVIGVNPYFGQFWGLPPYIAIGYLGSRHFAFRTNA